MGLKFSTYLRSWLSDHEQASQEPTTENIMRQWAKNSDVDDGAGTFLRANTQDFFQADGKWLLISELLNSLARWGAIVGRGLVTP